MKTDGLPENPIERQLFKLNEIYRARKQNSIRPETKSPYTQGQRNLRDARKRLRLATEQLHNHHVPDLRQVEKAEQEAKQAEADWQRDMNDKPREYYAELLRLDRERGNFIDVGCSYIRECIDDLLRVEILRRLWARTDVQQRHTHTQHLSSVARQQRRDYDTAEARQRELTDAQKKAEAEVAQQEAALQSWLAKQQSHASEESEKIARVEHHLLQRLGEETSAPSGRGLPGLPATIPWGHLLVDGSKSFPWKAGIPFRRPLLCRTENERWQAEMLVLQLLEAAEPKAVRIIGIDPVSFGVTFNHFNTQPVPLCEQGFIVAPRQIDDRLNTLWMELSDRAREKSGNHTDWASYKKAHPEDKSPYTILLVHGAEEVLLSHSSSGSLLIKLLSKGCPAGVLPILSLSDTLLPQRDKEELESILRHNNVQSISDTPPALDTLAQRYPAVSLGWAPSQPATEAERWARFNVCAATNASSSGRVDALWQSAAAPPAPVEDGLYIPIGWEEDGSLAYLEIGDSCANTFIGGISGSGKSNLQHVIIHSLLHHYSEDEISLYLMDLKQGVEMECYGNNLRAVKLLARACDQEYAQSLFGHLIGELDRRADLFRAAGCADYKSYRKTAEGRRLPRIVLMVDECQGLFAQNDYKSSVGMSAMLERLVRQGRSQGIHMLLSSQSISTEMTLRRGLWENIPGRIALACNEATSHHILSPLNGAAALITPGKQAILNMGYGQPAENRLLNIPLAKGNEEPLIPRHLQQLASPGYLPRIYDGAAPPPLPTAAEFRTLCNPQPALLLGRSKEWTPRPFLLPLCDAEEPKASLCLQAWFNGNEPQEGFLTALRLSVENYPEFNSVEVLSSHRMPAVFRSSAKFHLHAEHELTEERMAQLLTPPPAGHHKLIFVDHYAHLESLHNERNNPVANLWKNALKDISRQPGLHFIFYRTDNSGNDLAEKKLPSSIRLAQGSAVSNSWLGIAPTVGLNNLGDSEPVLFNIAVSRKGMALSYIQGFSAILPS